MTFLIKCNAILLKEVSFYKNNGISIKTAPVFISAPAIFMSAATESLVLITPNLSRF